MCVVGIFSLTTRIIVWKELGKFITKYLLSATFSVRPSWLRI